MDYDPADYRFGPSSVLAAWFALALFATAAFGLPALWCKTDHLWREARQVVLLRHA